MAEKEKITNTAANLWEEPLRRVRDLILSALLLAVLCPFFFLIAAVIVLDSPGASPIFRQIRIGKRGKPFVFYKFRSMIPGAEAQLERLLPYNEMDGPAFKIKNDPRITRFGKLLRRSGLDELPQLWNVMRGDMSLVGPRPGLPREVIRYDKLARQRLQVKPGMTCYWQLQPNRNELSFEEWMRLDQRYLRERSLWTDWKILFNTFGAVWGMNGQ